MTDFQRGIITLMKCAFTDETAQLPGNFSLEAAASFAVKQHIITLVYDGALRCGIPAENPVMKQLFPRYVQLVMHSERQLAETERICGAFDENKLDYLPLKGCNMKALYPKPELRYMGDADILIRVEQYDWVRKLMLELGLTEGTENYHEYHWNKDCLHVELHKSLIPSTSVSLYGYWGTGWDRAKKISGTRYALSPEEDFLFQFTHFTKHYIGPGIGCRYLLDLWVFLRAHPELDYACLERELQKLGLLEFYRNIRTLLTVWFEDGQEDDRTAFITDFIFSGSSWGNWEYSQVASVVKDKDRRSQNKIVLLLEKMFPPISKMAFTYPVLKELPVLLPVCWVLRIIRVLLFERKNRKKGMYILKSVSQERIDSYRAHMRYVGLQVEKE